MSTCTPPVSSSASIVGASGITGKTIRSRYGGPPSASGNVESRSMTSRSFARRSTKRYGPLPIGERLKAAVLSSPGGTSSSRCFGIGAHQKSSSACACGRPKSNRIVYGSRIVALSTSLRYADARSDADAGSFATSKVNFTSSAVSGWPSCQRTSRRRRKTTAVSPSRSQDSARYGRTLRSSSYWTSGVKSAYLISSSVMRSVFTIELNGPKSVLTPTTTVPPSTGGPAAAPAAPSARVALDRRGEARFPDQPVREEAAVHDRVERAEARPPPDDHGPALDRRAGRRAGRALVPPAPRGRQRDGHEEEQPRPPYVPHAH